MKQITIALLLVATMATAASADEVSGWDYFWGTTMNPDLNGVTDNWNQGWTVFFDGLTSRRI